MATINRNIRKYSDFNFLFVTHPKTKDLVKINNEDAIKQAVKSLILTVNYERLFHPEIGCQINALLFENFEPQIENLMTQTIEDTIRFFEPRARLTNVDVKANRDQNELIVIIQFAINNVLNSFEVITTLTRAR